MVYYFLIGLGLLWVILVISIFRTQRKINQYKEDTSKTMYPKDERFCEHKNWSSRYDYKTYPGTVAFTEARCLDCGVRENGSGQ